MTPIEQFQQAIAGAGLPAPDDIHGDGALHRFSTSGKRADQSGWYVLHDDGDIPAGAFGCWRSGLSQTWCSKDTKAMTQAERSAHQQRMQAIAQQREADTAQRQQDAATAAAKRWAAALPAPADHPYLARKGIQPHGARVEGEALLIPLRDMAGTLHSLQAIGPEGDKRFQPGGRIKGCYFAIGKPAGVLVIAEGMATGASIHEATGHAVACAMNAGNLLEVAQALHSKYPKLRLILAADDDWKTEGNPGMTKAREAAKAVGGNLSKPNFGEHRGDKETDFNDLHQRAGLDAVRACLDAAVDVAANPVFPPLEDGEQVRTTHGQKSRSVVLACGADLSPTPIRWLWPGWLALGKLHILAGAPGQGKTTIALAMAATVTVGGRWPDGERCDQGNILIWSGEDDPADTLLPRLLAMGADRQRCHFIKGTRGEDGSMSPFDPANDLPGLRDAIQGIGGVRLLIVDPVVSAVTGDSHKNTEVRRALQPLVEMADACDCAVLGITHFAKGGQGTDPAQRVVGSVAFTAVARIVMVAAKVKGDEEGKDARILARGKSNIGPDDGGFEYHLEQCEPIPGISASCIAWGKAVEGSARELLSDPDEPQQEETSDAAEMLRAELDSVLWTSSDDAAKPLKAAGFSRKQIWQASKKLGVARKKDGMKGGWLWRLRGPSEVAFTMLSPEDSAEDSEDSYFGNGESSESSGALESSATEVL